MVPADDAAGGVAAGRGAGAALVPVKVADRGLAPRAEVGLQGGVPRASDGRADRAGGDDQRGDRLAADGDDAAGAGDAGTAGRSAVLGHRDHGAERFREGPQAAAPGQSRARGANDGDPGWLPEPQQGTAARSSENLVRLHAPERCLAGLRATHPNEARQRFVQASGFTLICVSTAGRAC